MKSIKTFKMTPNKTLIFALLALSACGKHSREDEPQQMVYQNSQQSLFEPYIAQGSIFTREVKNMPLATNSAAIAAYMPKMPAEYLPERFKKTVLTTLSTTSYNIPIYVVDSNNPSQEYANFESKDNRVIYKKDLVQYTTGRIPLPKYAQPAGGGDKSNFKDLGKDNFAMQHTTGGSAVVCMLNPLSQIGIAEARKGEICHALSFTIANAGKGFSYPAKQGDGTSTNPNAPLEGQWFRIDPKIDLNKLKLRPFTLLVAKAVQKYGGYAADKNLFCHTFTAEHPINEMVQGKPNPWEKGGDIYEKYNGIDLNDFPWHLTQWAPVDWGK